MVSLIVLTNFIKSYVYFAQLKAICADFCGVYILLCLYTLILHALVICMFIFCSGFDCIVILKFGLYCVVMLCMYVLYYVSMVIVSFILCMWLYVYCSGAEERHLPSTRVETINQSINQSINRY